MSTRAAAHAQHALELEVKLNNTRQQVIERMVLGNRRHQSHHALVTVATGQFGQALTIRFDQAHARIAGLVDELPHAGVATRDLEMDFDNGLGGDLEANAYGMKAVQHFVR